MSKEKESSVIKIDSNFNLPARAKLYAKKPVIIKAIRMPAEFEVQTPTGPERGFSGDYLAMDREGGFYPIKKEVFEKNFDEVTVGRP